MLSINSPIELLPFRYDVTDLVYELRNPDVWNRHPVRLYGPHSSLADVWVRYNAWENYDSRNPAAFNEPHESVWYPVIADIPAVLPLVFRVMHDLRAEQLGGVLITKIPAGEMCKPHIDHGWHARHYEKVAVQLASAPGQAFCFERKRLSAVPGESYVFDNSQTHFVINESDEDRMTLIICIRRSLPCLGA